MNDKIRVSETHVKQVRKTFSWNEIKSILERHVLDNCGEDISHLPYITSARSQDEVEGSPSYKVGTKIYLEITVDIGSKLEEIR